MRLFDYTFYILYTYYLKKEKISTSIFNTTYAVMSLQICLLLGFGILLQFIFQLDKELHELISLSKLAFFIMLILLAITWEKISLRNYKKRLPEILKKYKNHPRNKWFRVWMLYFLAVGFILIPIFIVKVLKTFS